MKHQRKGKSYYISFFNGSDWVREQKKNTFFPLEFGSVNPHIFTDPNPGSQHNTDPDH